MQSLGWQMCGGSGEGWKKSEPSRVGPLQREKRTPRCSVEELRSGPPTMGTMYVSDDWQNEKNFAGRDLEIVPVGLKK